MEKEKQSQEHALHRRPERRGFTTLSDKVGTSIDTSIGVLEISASGEPIVTGSLVSLWSRCKRLSKSASIWR